MSYDELQQMLVRYTEGNASEAERAFLERYYQYHGSRKEAPGALDNGLLAAHRHASLEELHALMPLPVRRVHFIRRWSRAAAIVLALATGAYLWISDKKQPDHNNPSSLAKTDIQPGGNKAILTLSNGEKLILDSMANGAIAAQGGAEIVKLANGQIAYNLRGMQSGERMSNTMSTPRGGQYHLTLQDGTKVWLNAASSITYPVAFTDKERKVKITGEVYLEVAQSKDKPFLADIDGRSVVEVLGTSFNVNAYKEENVIRTTLMEGSVRVITGNQKAILKPGEQAISQPALTITTANISETLAWKNGRFNFEGASLSELMRQVERWYDVKVVYPNGIPEVEFAGTLKRNVTLQNLLKALEKTGVRNRLEADSTITILPTY